PPGEGEDRALPDRLFEPARAGTEVATHRADAPRHRGAAARPGRATGGLRAAGPGRQQPPRGGTRGALQPAGGGRGRARHRLATAGAIRHYNGGIATAGPPPARAMLDSPGTAPIRGVATMRTSIAIVVSLALAATALTASASQTAAPVWEAGSHFTATLHQ